jgi:hypothetical protein
VVNVGFHVYVSPGEAGTSGQCWFPKLINAGREVEVLTEITGFSTKQKRDTDVTKKISASCRCLVSKKRENVNKGEKNTRKEFTLLDETRVGFMSNPEGSRCPSSTCTPRLQRKAPVPCQQHF